jgi:hypothetical protein
MFWADLTPVLPKYSYMLPPPSPIPPLDLGAMLPRPGGSTDSVPAPSPP